MSNKLNNLRYYFFSFIYDLTLSAFYKRFIKKLMAAVNAQTGQQVLEVGIGTDITIPFYHQSKTVTGIDPSAAMLRIARKKAAATPNLKLVQASAETNPLNASTFDQIIFCSTLSVVDQPKEVLQQHVNALKPNGSIFILNHFTPETGIMHFLDKLLVPVGKILGFKSFFPLSTLVDPATMRVTPLLQGYWSIIQVQKAPAV